jgi:DNA-binding IclR family transcriptional regulator
MATDVPAVTAAMRILESLAAAAPGSVSPGQLVHEHQLNRSTCYNILAALQRGGWAISKGDRAGWTLGPRLLALVSGSAELLMRLVQEELDRLSDELGFVAMLTERVPSGGYVVVAKGERRTGVRVTVGVGDTFPFSAPALMQATCAWLPETEVESLIATHGLQRFTPNTETDPAEVLALLTTVRARGYSTSLRGQFNLNQGAVAAPVFDHRGRVDRAVAILAFPSHLSEENGDEVGAAVRACADRITTRTGGVVPGADVPDYDRDAVEAAT